MSTTTSRNVIVSLVAGSKEISFDGSPDLSWVVTGDKLYVAGTIPLLIGSTSPIRLQEDAPATVTAGAGLVVASYVNLRDALTIINRQSEEFAQWFRKLNGGNSLWVDVRVFPAATPTYTLINGDENVYYIHQESGAIDITIDSDSVHNFPIGARMAFDRYIGGGAITFTTDIGVTLDLPAGGAGAEVGAAGKVGIIIKMAANTWRLITNDSNYTGFMTADGSEPFTGNLTIDIPGASPAMITVVNDIGGARLEAGAEVNLVRVDPAGNYVSDILTTNATNTELTHTTGDLILKRDATGVEVFGLTAPVLKSTATETTLSDETGAAHIIARDGEKTEFPLGAKSSAAPVAPEDLVNLAFLGAYIASGGLETVEINSSIILTAAHNGVYLKCVNSGDITITVPTKATEDLGDGFTVAIDRKGVGEVVIAAEATVDVVVKEGDTTSVDYNGVAGITKNNDADNQFSLYGALVSSVQYVPIVASDGEPKVIVDGVQQPLSNFSSTTGVWSGTTVEGNHWQVIGQILTWSGEFIIPTNPPPSTLFSIALLFADATESTDNINYPVFSGAYGVQSTHVYPQPGLAGAAAAGIGASPGVISFTSTNTMDTGGSITWTAVGKVHPNWLALVTSA